MYFDHIDHPIPQRLFPGLSPFINVIILYLETSTGFKYMFHFIYIHICKLKEILVQKTRKTIFSL